MAQLPTSQISTTASSSPPARSGNSSACPKWQKDLKACWESLSKGEYDWAHLAYTIWPSRVKDACKTDRSIAIAHGLEELCEIKTNEKKAKKGKPKKEQLDLKEDIA